MLLQQPCHKLLNNINYKRGSTVYSKVCTIIHTCVQLQQDQHFILGKCTHKILHTAAKSLYRKTENFFPKYVPHMLLFIINTEHEAFVVKTELDGFVKSIVH